MGCKEGPCEGDTTNDKFFMREFPRYGKVICYLKYLEKKYPKLVSVESIGFSIKGRDIIMAKLCKRSSKSKAKSTKPKGIVLVDACIHAREWITVTSAMHVVHHLLECPKLLYQFDFYVIPCLNPDGYEFTHTDERLWRKNLNPNGTCCLHYQGVDLNRNFPTAFGGQGGSGKKHSETFRGEYPLSEPESRALACVFQKLHHRIKLYISLHTYGNCIMYPWGYKCTPTCDEKELRRCGNRARSAMYRCYKRKYRVGSIAERMYVNCGNTTDYARKAFNIKFSYTIELQKGHESGFTIGAEKIPEVGGEVVAGIEAMSNYVFDYYDVSCGCKQLGPPGKRRRLD